MPIRKVYENITKIFNMHTASKKIFVGYIMLWGFTFFMNFYQPSKDPYDTHEDAVALILLSFLVGILAILIFFIKFLFSKAINRKDYIIFTLLIAALIIIIISIFYTCAYYNN